MSEETEETKGRGPIFYVLTAGLICFSVLYLVGAIIRLTDPPEMNRLDGKTAANLRLESQDQQHN